MSVQYESLSVGPMDNNAYLVSDDAGHLILVDAAAEADRLLSWIDGRTLDAVVTTHRHHDHIEALAAVVGETGATAWCGQPDAQAIQDATGVACQTLWTGDQIAVGDESLEVIGLVGHTPGGIALVLPSDPVAIITGDSLFPGGVGKTNSTDDFTSLLDDVTKLIFDRFDDQTVILPGHGDTTTLGAERPHLDEWRARGW